MKALVIHRYGDGSIAGIEDIPVPVPDADEVLIKVRAVSINPLDWKVREGKARIFTGSRFPKVLGTECAGIVEQTGAGAGRFRHGDRVVLYTGVKRLGACAQYACGAEDAAYPLPESVPFEQASCLPIAGLTALQSLRDHGRLEAGMNVLVNGAAGGVGHLAVQIAKVLGASVTGVCSAANSGFVMGLGADRTIDYAAEDFTLGTERYDLIFDAVSKRSFGECKRVLSPRGRYVSTLPDRTLIAQLVTLFLPGKKAKSMWVRQSAEDMTWLLEQLSAGRVRVAVEQVYPFAEIADAFALSESGHARGKVVAVLG